MMGAVLVGSECAEPRLDQWFPQGGNLIFKGGGNSRMSY